MRIPFMVPYLTGQELEYIEAAIKGNQLSGDGKFTKLVQQWLEEKYQPRRAILTTSATHALELAALLIDLQPGDEVLMPSFTFPSTANAVCLRGAKPVFVEIDEKTLNIDPEDVAAKVTPATKAIIPVHYAGVACEMDRLMEIANEQNLWVVEDAAQAINAKYRQKYLGTLGHLGCFSFHGTKNITAGEGGALLINIEDPRLKERAEIICQKGTNRLQFIRGEVDKYTWVDIGSSYVPSDILMAFLFAQLNQIDKITLKRKQIHEYYMLHLQPYADQGLISLPSIPENCDSNYHLFYLLFSDEKTRNQVKEELGKMEIQTSFHYIPLHSSPMGRRLGYSAPDLALTEKISRCLLRLPFSTGMSEVEITYVIESLRKIFQKIWGI